MDYFNIFFVFFFTLLCYYEKGKLFLAYNMKCAVKNYHHWAFFCIGLFQPQKIEVIDEDEEDDDFNVELMASDLEQMQSLLEFKVNRHRRAVVMISFQYDI